MLGGAEFTDPVSYPAWLWWLVAVPPVLVVAWYSAVTRWAMSPRRPLTGRRLNALQRDHLERLDRVEAEVAAGAMPLRAAHQTISEIVRSFAAAAGSPHVRSLPLDRLRAAGPGPLVDVVALVYPAEFAPGGQGEPSERLGPALEQARGLVRGWETGGGDG